MDKTSAPPIVPVRREMIGRKEQNNPNNKSKLDSERTDSGTKNNSNQAQMLWKFGLGMYLFAFNFSAQNDLFDPLQAVLR